MEITLTDRVKTVMENEGLSPSSFADFIGILRPSMSHILSGRNKPSIDIIQKIISTLPHYNPVWLINGTGNMLQLDLFESEDDTREKQQEKEAAQKAAAQDRRKNKVPSKNINFVKQALDSNILDDEETIVPTPPQFQNQDTVVEIQNTVRIDSTNSEDKNKPEILLTNFSLDHEEEPAVEKNIESSITYSETTSIEETPILQVNDTEAPVEYNRSIDYETKFNEAQFKIAELEAELQKLKSQQNNTTMPIPPTLDTQKKVEKIVIFYADKTFESYQQA